MPAELQASRQDASLILTLSNPGAENRLHPDIYAAAIETLATAERDESIRTVILTGSGNTFCGGAERMAETSGKSVALNDLGALQGWIEAILDCPKPVIAAVEGSASGAGLALALASDFVVAANSAQFSMPAVKLGLTPDAGLWLLVQNLPRQLAAEILIAARPLTSVRMHQVGVVNFVAEDGKALDAALTWAEHIAALPSSTIERIKGMLREASLRSLTAYMEVGKNAFIENVRRGQTQETA